MLAAAVGLLGCEHHEDSAFICIVPIDCACDRELGPSELRVHTSWYKREKNDLGTETWFECGDSTLPLAAGTWVIWSGEESGELVIPSEAWRCFACRDEGRWPLLIVR